MGVSLGIRLLCGAVVLAAVSPRAAAEPRTHVHIAVVVGANSEQRAISMRYLRRVYNGKTRSRAIIPLNRPAGSRVRATFDRAVLSLSPSEVGRYWVDRAVRGQRGPPRSFASARAILRLVARFPRAMGYVRADRVRGKVRVVAVDGKLPGQPGYPLVMERAK